MIRLLGSLIFGLLISCSSPVEERAQQPSGKIDSEIEFSRIAAIKEKVSIVDFLVALGLSEAGDDSTSVLGLIRYLDTEGSVNHYKLEGGGGVAFTTRLNLSNREMADAVYSEQILTDAVTSFNCDYKGRELSFRLEGGIYVNLERSPKELDRQ